MRLAKPISLYCPPASLHQQAGSLHRNTWPSRQLFEGTAQDDHFTLGIEHPSHVCGCAQERLDLEKAKKDAAQQEAAEKAKAEAKDNPPKEKVTENGAAGRDRAERPREGRDAERSMRDRERDRDRPAGRSDRCIHHSCCHHCCHCRNVQLGHNPWLGIE